MEKNDDSHLGIRGQMFIAEHNAESTDKQAERQRIAALESDRLPLVPLSGTTEYRACISVIADLKWADDPNWMCLKALLDLIEQREQR